ncbi:hypothetical protein [Mesorhizobium sp.]|uniref:hypothetical protein n=1 Tax=Mesorhizobium sp. TaxID=1871066 RepID=UPI001208AED5|nr:hypothetical protein [Mesorhizobium sp.]TIQ96684.1 MAG: hypothetical protein E5X36_19185 [Mesorhizobium sp.]
MASSMAEYKRQTRAHIAGLQGQLTDAQYRAELAEKQARQISADRDIWKHRTLQAEAELRSTGRRG